MTYTPSADLFRRAQAVLPGGVSRSTILYGSRPHYVDRGHGCWVVDREGNEVLDVANNMLSLIHGHAHPAVVDTLKAQAELGTAFTMGTELEVAYAEALCGRSPAFEMVRFVNSGTEAVMAALKVARACAGRPKIAKVEGSYHGTYDYAEVSQVVTPDNWGPAHRPASVPLARGVPDSVAEDVVVLPFNDPARAVELLDEHADEIACVLLDLMPHRVGLIPADQAFVAALRSWTREHGALLVLDEVVTFRVEPGGMQARYGVQADLTALGKVIGGGLPAGAVAGKQRFMEAFTPRDGALPWVSQSGTFSANPMTMAAGGKAMELYDDAAVARLNELGELARDKIAAAISAAGAPASVVGAGSLFRIHLCPEAPSDYRSSYRPPLEGRLLSQFVANMYEAGVMLIYSGAGGLSTPMGPEEIDHLADAVHTSLRKINADEVQP